MMSHTLVEVIGDVHWVSLSGPRYQVAADKVQATHTGLSGCCSNGQG